MGNGLLFLALVFVDARSRFAVVTVVCKRSVFGESWGGEHTVVNIWILFFQRAFHVAPSVDHRRLAVTETLGVIVTEVNRSDLVLVIQILEELHVFFGHIVVVVGFLAIFAEEQFTLLIVQTLIDGAVGIAVEVEAGLRHLAAVGLGEPLGDLDEFVPCGRNVGVGEARFAPQCLVVVDVTGVDHGVDVLDFAVLIFMYGCGGVVGFQRLGVDIVIRCVWTNQRIVRVVDVENSRTVFAFQSQRQLGPIIIP